MTVVGKRVVLPAALTLGAVAATLTILVLLGLANLDVDAELPVIRRAATNPSVADEGSAYRWLQLGDHQNLQLPVGRPYSAEYVWQALPEEAPHPSTNKPNPDKIKLGEMLFNDKNLSFDRSVSCASCHELVQRAGADGRPLAIGIRQQSGNRNSPTVWNTAFQARFFWDGRADSLEQQAREPFVNPVEMGMPSLELVASRVADQSRYLPLFRAAFGDDAIDIDNISKAIAAYERTLITADTPYDHFVRGDHAALSDSQIRGMKLFTEVGCTNCHSGPNFSSASVFAGEPSMPRLVFPAVPTPYEQQYDLLIEDPAGNRKQRGVWRVPSLRNVALTGPWFHNGSVTRLRDAIRIMAASQLGLSGHYLQWSAKSHTIREIDRPLLSEQQVSDIEAFLQALTSESLLAQRGNRYAGLDGQ